MQKQNLQLGLSQEENKRESPNLVVVSSNHNNIDNWEKTIMEVASPGTDTSTDPDIVEKNQWLELGHLAAPAASDPGDELKGILCQKTLRRLAQNREAARKSRLKKKEYIQQLENCKMKLTQLEQELERARRHGIFIPTSGDLPHSMLQNGALAFNMEYVSWLEQHNKLTNELRAAVHTHAGDDDLQSIVDNIMAHYEEIFRLKSIAAKADAFHVISGMWKTPVERFFLWLGGFRSSDLLKLLASQLEPLTEKQLANICNLRQSSKQSEDALSKAMEAMQWSIAETLTSGSLSPAGSSAHMAAAMGKLGALENLLQQADNLRLETLQQIQSMLTTRQSARALLAISDHFSQLRTLSSLWVTRPLG